MLFWSHLGCLRQSSEHPCAGFGCLLASWRPLLAAQARRPLFLQFYVQTWSSHFMRRLRGSVPYGSPGRVGGLFSLRRLRRSACGGCCSCLYIHMELIFYAQAAGILAWGHFGVSQGLSHGRVWALLGSSGLPWALQGYPELSWAPWALLGVPGLSLGYLRVAGRNSDAGRHTLGSLAAIVMLGAIP